MEAFWPIRPNRNRHVGHTLTFFVESLSCSRREEGALRGCTYWQLVGRSVVRREGMSGKRIWLLSLSLEVVSVEEDAAAAAKGDEKK